MTNLIKFENQLLLLMRSLVPFHTLCFEWTETSIIQQASCNIYHKKRENVILSEEQKMLFVLYANQIAGEANLSDSSTVYQVQMLAMAPGRNLLYFHDISEQVQHLHDWKQKALTDNLTGLGNHRKIYQIIEQLLNDKEDHVIAFIDINNLKQINDRFGHAVGDAYICSLANILQSYSDKSAPACRIGGDEFLLFLSKDCDVEQILQKIISEAFHDTKVSIAVGYIFFGKKERNIQSILERADKEMYRQKQNQSKINKEKRCHG